MFLGSKIVIVGCCPSSIIFHHGKGHYGVSGVVKTSRFLAHDAYSFGNGLNTSTVPTWQSECSKSHSILQDLCSFCRHVGFWSHLLSLLTTCPHAEFPPPPLSVSPIGRGTLPIFL